jgi:hypothetical protein
MYVLAGHSLLFRMIVIKAEAFQAKIVSAAT